MHNNSIKIEILPKIGRGVAIELCLQKWLASKTNPKKNNIFLFLLSSNSNTISFFFSTSLIFPPNLHLSAACHHIHTGNHSQSNLHLSLSRALSSNFYHHLTSQFKKLFKRIAIISSLLHNFVFILLRIIFIMRARPPIS